VADVLTARTAVAPDVRVGTGVAAFGLGTALPARVVSTAEIAARVGVEEDWILSRTGIRERRHAGPEDSCTSLATEAGRRSLAHAGVDPAEVDLVLVATMSADELTPNAAPVVAHALGAHRAGAFDVGAACTAFLGGLALGGSWVEAGRAETVLVIGVDLISRFLDFDDRATAALFSDGAGAVVLAATDGPSRLGPVVLGADGAYAGAIHAAHEDRIIRMDGPEVFRHAVARMTEATVTATARAGLSLDEVDLWVFHQANARILRAVGTRLGLDPDRVVSSIETFGNNSAATLPLALDAARADGRLHDGARVGLAAFGAGFTWGATVLEWGRP
jgi:3-oxoacyl-[acyl-carrier-protein] synthase-3